MSQREIDWGQIQRWDEKYYLHVKQAAKEYRFLPVSRTEGNYVHLVGGHKVLDFVSQIIGANLGYRHPRVTSAIKEAADKIGFDRSFSAPSTEAGRPNSSWRTFSALTSGPAGYGS